MDYMLGERKRLIEVLDGQRVDRPPFIGPGCLMPVAVAEAMEAVGCYWPDVHDQPRTLALLGMTMHDRAAFENVGIPFALAVEAEAMGAPVDLGVTLTSPRIIGYALDSASDISALKSIKPREDNHVGIVLEATKILADETDEIPITGSLTGPITLAASLIEPLTLFKAMRRDVAGVNGLMAFLADNLINYGRTQIEAGADIIVISDPSAAGDILGPRLFREFALPYINKIIDGLGDGFGTRTILHVCGNALSILPELSQAKAAGLCLDDSINCADIRTFLKGKILVGSIDNKLIAEGPAGKIAKAGRRALDKGVDILTPPCGLTPTAKLEHIRALAGAVRVGAYARN